jgi:hypothetical protein
MQATTLRAQTALYTNGRYYVHGWKNDRGTFTVIAGKRGQFRRGFGTTIASQTCATYEEAAKQFALLRTQIDQIVSDATVKRFLKSDARKTAIATYKATTPNPWKVGDLCHTSWGYDQTNVDAFQVIEVKSRTTIIVRPISGEVVDTGYLQGKFTPVKDRFSGQPITVVAGFGYWPHATGGNGNCCSESWAVNGHSLYETKPGQSHHFSSYA